MAKAVKPAQTTGAIVAAKEKGPIVMGSKIVVTPKEDIASHWEKSSGGTIQGMANSIKKYGIRSQGGSADLLNFENVDQSELKRPTEAREMLERKDVPLSERIATHAGSDASARLQVMDALKDMYRSADKANLKTRDQFATSYNELLKTTSPRNRALLSDPRFQQQISNLRDVASQHYADLIKSRDESASKPSAPAAVEKVTEVATPSAKAVKIKVQKK